MQPHEEFVADAMGCHLRQTAALDGLLDVEECRRAAIQEHRIGQRAHRVRCQQILQIDQGTQGTLLQGNAVTVNNDFAAELHLVPMVAHLIVRPCDWGDRMRAHLFGLVGEQRIEFTVTLVAADRDEDVTTVTDGDHFAFAAGQGTLHLEFGILGKQVAADAEN